jgi:phage protein U
MEDTDLNLGFILRRLILQNLRFTVDLKHSSTVKSNTKHQRQYVPNAETPVQYPLKIKT